MTASNTAVEQVVIDLDLNLDSLCKTADHLQHLMNSIDQAVDLKASSQAADLVQRANALLSKAQVILDRTYLPQVM